MASYDNTYSRFIVWAKIILPLLALATLSTVFLIAQPVDPSKAIPYAKVDVQELARERGVTAPNYAGITRDGAAISLSAKSAKPETTLQGDTVNTDTFHAEIELPDGALITLSSTTGQLNSAAQNARLTGDVTITSSAGYIVRSEEISASLEEARFASDVPISATSPMGRLTAGQLELTHRNQMYLLVFKNGVKLVYDPEG